MILIGRWSLATCAIGLLESADNPESTESGEDQTEERFHIAAHTFLHCKGYGHLGSEAGAAFHRGREERTDHGEPDALPQADSKSLGSTILFTGRRHDRPMPFTAPPWARCFTEADFAHRPWGGKEIDRGLEYGFWWCAWGGELDAIRDHRRRGGWPLGPNCCAWRATGSAAASTTCPPPSPPCACVRWRPTVSTTLA